MSDQRTEQQPPQDGEESDFGSRLKVRLAIAGALVALALAAIPILDNLTGKHPESADSSNSAGNIAGLSASQPAAVVASAPAATASAGASSQPAGSAPAGPNLEQTPGMTATPPLSLPPVAEPAATTATSNAHRSNSAPRPQAERPVMQPPVVAHQAGKAFKQGYPPPGSNLTTGTLTPQGPVSNSNQPAIQPLPAAAIASQSARPPGSSVGYNVQLGLFSNMENAQKLIAELKSKGIEVQSETRIHLAPFRTRAEAEQAVAKLRALGYAPMLGAAGN